MTCRSGWSPASRVMNASTGNVNGSARSTKVCGSSVSAGSGVGHPLIAGPSGVLTIWRPRGVTEPSRHAAQTDSAGTSSASTAPPITASAVIPTSAAGSSSRRRASVMSSSAPTKCGDAKNTTRSGGSPSSCSSTLPATSPTACAGIGCCDNAAAYLLIVSASVLSARAAWATLRSSRLRPRGVPAALTRRTGSRDDDHVDGLGPCTPIVWRISRSAVRLGPLTQLMVLGWGSDDCSAIASSIVATRSSARTMQTCAGGMMWVPRGRPGPQGSSNVGRGDRRRALR